MKFSKQWNENDCDEDALPSRDKESLKLIERMVHEDTCWMGETIEWLVYEEERKLEGELLRNKTGCAQSLLANWFTLV